MSVQSNRKKKRGQVKKCGIIMPISIQQFGQYKYPMEYWSSLLAFLKDTIKKAGYEAVPMWEDETISSITPRIVKNIMEVPLAICVISAFNPNVMMELGMRLCCNKPVLVIMDENISSIPFDIKDVEAYQIPSHPIYSQYEPISKKIQEYLHKMDNPGYKAFLDNFSLQPPKLGLDSVPEVLNDGEQAPFEVKLKKLEGRVAMLEAEKFVAMPENTIGPTGPSPVAEAPTLAAEVGWLHQ